MVIDVFITGVPYSQSKTRGNREAASLWSAAVIKQTSKLPKLTGPCSVKASFVLPIDKFPSDHPHGSDLDNLTKRLFDALNETIFSNMPGTDGAVQILNARKRKAKPGEASGVRLVCADLKIPMK
ncbi:MAG: RusA family crossover junction endodeoxyribonuclease [Dehalococcoidia bacterium]|nr:RusA family crossover junction endodeoxyribonuclease [Dehalococcoidia bacterium]